MIAAPLAAPYPPDGVDARGPSLPVRLGHRVPLERQSPVEPADHRLVRLHVELEGVPIDGVYYWAHYGAFVFANPAGEG